MQLKSIKSKMSKSEFEEYLTRYIKSNDRDSVYFSPPTIDSKKYEEADIRDKEIYLSERITISSLPCRVCKSTNTKSVEASNRGMDEGGAAIVDCLSCGAHYREA
jgi:DNA-directed RNA polymerase subunit M/transcription elongation factor TFIIS